ncbi:hypothetical protein BCR33DRAFT_793237 [Rhizoclosmatium globosum]|uniref:Uncharacterized protein n=1 Tax=Rhizoclosmatium globosum TaxID=329046 RepID=A0A1Y2B1M6_9FUNG|nr:hypothetical protein BCR33DRAFT_793237 [Rhizoclosmatium globosum]|eukprot:ORY28712.1 hypothetical protein BCR33DRAFT_793237 [Rhizoclosmatium globosum]
MATVLTAAAQTSDEVSTDMDQDRETLNAGSEPEDWSGRYSQSLEDRLDLARKLEAAETKANALVSEIKLVSAEAEALRRIIENSGLAEALKQMPPKSKLSAFLNDLDSLPSASSLAINQKGQITTSALDYDSKDEVWAPPPISKASVHFKLVGSFLVMGSLSFKVEVDVSRLLVINDTLPVSTGPGHLPLFYYTMRKLMEVTGSYCHRDIRIDLFPSPPKLILTKQPSHLPKKFTITTDNVCNTKLYHKTDDFNSSRHKSRLSTSSSVPSDISGKMMPSPQSMNHSPQGTKRNLLDASSRPLQQQQPAPAASSQQQQQQQPIVPSSAATSRKSSTSNVHDPNSPLPPNSLAWTDIIRTRYPHFQRSTVQTSKHAREFIETRKIPFYRVTPTHSLGRSKPTYAIPPDMHKDFLEYFEEKFGVLGVLGRRRVGGDILSGMPGFDDSSAGSVVVNAGVSMNGGGGGGGGSSVGAGEEEDEEAAAAAAAGSGSGSGGAVEPGVSASEFDSSASDKGKGKRKSAAAAAAASLGQASSLSSAAATPVVVASSKKRVVKEEEDGDFAAGGEVTKKPSKSAKISSVSKSGLSLTRYNAIVNKMMPEFKSLSNEARLAIKRGVKQFLQHEMGSDFEECLMMTAADNGQASKPTYGVPEHLVPSFQQWLHVELSKCFPSAVILAPPA